MTKVVLEVTISGTHNGENWPAKGSVVDLPDAIAADMLTTGQASKPGEKSAPEKATAPEPETAVVPAPEPAKKPAKKAAAKKPAKKAAAKKPKA